MFIILLELVFLQKMNHYLLNLFGNNNHHNRFIFII